MKYSTLIAIALTSTLIGCGGGGGKDSNELRYHPDYNEENLLPEMTFTNDNLPMGNYKFFFEEPMGICESGVSFAATPYYSASTTINFEPGPAREGVIEGVKSAYYTVFRRELIPHNNREVIVHPWLYTGFFSKFIPAGNTTPLRLANLRGLTHGERAQAYSAEIITYKDLRDTLDYRATIILKGRFRENGWKGDITMVIEGIDNDTRCRYTSPAWAKKEGTEWMTR
jgi:hypothetical protein